MANLIDTLLLLALPAAGKSEIRFYLDSLDREHLAEDFRLGPIVDLDDYPYVHLMRRISQELRHDGEDPVFFSSDHEPMLDGRDWGTLIHLLNEDYAELGRGHAPEPETAAGWLLDRLDRARHSAGAPSPFGAMATRVRSRLEAAIESDARRLWSERTETMRHPLADVTTIIEFARGGPDGAELPLPAPHGYRYSLGELSAEILDRASVLYVWVTPAESRRRNLERAKPGIEGDASILFHGVPQEVMLGDYGTDDMEWLLEQSSEPGTVQVEAHGRTNFLPAARFDNRVDHTSFVRDHPWPSEAVARLHHDLMQAFRELSP